MVMVFDDWQHALVRGLTFCRSDSFGMYCHVECSAAFWGLSRLRTLQYVQYFRQHKSRKSTSTSTLRFWYRSLYSRARGRRAATNLGKEMRLTTTAVSMLEKGLSRRKHHGYFHVRERTFQKNERTTWLFHD
jgi:hypothetical protein